MPPRLRWSRAIALELRGGQFVAQDLLGHHRYEIDRGALD